MEKPKEEKKNHHQTLTAPHPQGPGLLMLLWLSRRPQESRGVTAVRAGVTPSLPMPMTGRP